MHPELALTKFTTEKASITSIPLISIDWNKVSADFRILDFISLKRMNISNYRAMRSEKVYEYTMLIMLLTLAE